MEDIVVHLGDRHRVVIDDLNHTLQQLRPTKNGAENWKTLGYYQTFGAIVRRLATSSDISKKDYTAAQYADEVINKAMALCDQLNAKSGD